MRLRAVKSIRERQSIFRVPQTLDEEANLFPKVYLIEFSVGMFTTMMYTYNNVVYMQEVEARSLFIAFHLELRGHW